MVSLVAVSSWTSRLAKSMVENLEYVIAVISGRSHYLYTCQYLIGLGTYGHI